LKGKTKKVVVPDEIKYVIDLNSNEDLGKALCIQNDANNEPMCHPSKVGIPKFSLESNDIMTLAEVNLDPLRVIARKYNNKKCVPRMNWYD
jgi:hypothetical protein